MQPRDASHGNIAATSWQITLCPGPFMHPNTTFCPYHHFRPTTHYKLRTHTMPPRTRAQQQDEQEQGSTLALPNKTGIKKASKIATKSKTATKSKSKQLRDEEEKSGVMKTTAKPKSKQGKGTDEEEKKTSSTKSKKAR